VVDCFFVGLIGFDYSNHLGIRSDRILAAALNKRFEQGWLKERETSLDRVIERIKEARITKESISIGWLVSYLGIELGMPSAT
jgi:hypothetical protein